ncbi:MAG: TIM barrel protein [bacterium]|nr:TIM barrel protein [bacterium]
MRALITWLLLSATAPAQTPADWLIDASAYEVTVDEKGDEIALSNGLVRRVWRLTPNGACVAFDNLVTGASLLRSVRPEARLTVNGVPYDVGGLVGQPNHAYLTREWLDALEVDPTAMELVDWNVLDPSERVSWKRVRHHAPGATWPPKGIHLRMEYAPPAVDAGRLTALAAGAVVPASDLGRERLLHDDLTVLGTEWRIHASDAHPRSSFTNEGKTGEIYTPANTSVYAERDLPPGCTLVEATFDVGTDDSASWGPGLALVFQERVIKLHLRPQDDGLGLWDGERERPKLAGRMPLDTSRPWTLRLRVHERRVSLDARRAGDAWANYGHVGVTEPLGDPLALRVGKLDVRGGGEDHASPGELVRTSVRSVAAYGAIDLDRARERLEGQRQLRVVVHYELYAGLPVFSKWITVHNDGAEFLTVDRMTVEELAVVEHANWVESREGVALPAPHDLHVETDFAFGGFNHPNANRHAVHWRTDPLYTTQVNWARQQPCLLVVEPTYGPAQDVAPRTSFDSFRVFELAYDSTDRERRGLALRRMYRTIAPWVTENPIMHHLRTARREDVVRAIDQAAEVGFEMIILSFGSGFDIETEDEDAIEAWRELADYADAKGVELGGYSLLSSRSIGGGNDIVSPAGQRPTHGSCPALASEWGQRYFAKLYAFFAKTGFDLLEHDGPYPGDVDVTPRPPLQKGEDDSRWVQWRIAADFYAWCRGQGIYLNTPDYYFLVGSNKCGMGYREVNWSLPRAQQVIHTRQNIYDGTWHKTPSMGWMFVPLSQYHGGGAAATIEPLDEHRPHYDRMMASNLGLGVQACYRGPRLYDTDATRELVRGWVDWFKQHRGILESDVIHGRRADGRDVDWMLHVGPELDEKGMLVVYNPLEEDVARTLRVNLYYTGLDEVATVEGAEGKQRRYTLARDYTIDVEVRVPAGGMSWYVIR